MLWLPPAELDELLDDLWVNLSAADSRVAASVLDTVGVVYEAYDTYRTRFPEADEAYRRRRQRLLGMLMRGLYGIDDAVRQEAAGAVSSKGATSVSPAGIVPSGMGCAQVSFSPPATPKISAELPSRSLLKSPPATQ